MSGTGIFEGKTEEQAREQILSQVREYCDEFHKKKTYKEGDRISYAGRVYDAEEMVNLVDSALEFWLTSGIGKRIPFGLPHLNQYSKRRRELFWIK